LADELGALSAEDLELLAAAAYLLGHVDECRLALQRAHQMHIATSAVARAARCLFWVAFTLLLEGNLAPASGWLARTGRLLGTADPECAEHGLLMLPVGLEADATGDTRRRRRSSPGRRRLVFPLVTLTSGRWPCTFRVAPWSRSAARGRALRCWTRR
jgi:hypothetical protein